MLFEKSFKLLWPNKSETKSNFNTETISLISGVGKSAGQALEVG
jgi:hypothetical protein